MGRPSSFTQEIADRICERIAGGEPLRQICRDDEMPPWQTVYGWLDAHPDFSERFARARILGFDAIAEDTIEIADTPADAVIITEKADGSVETKRGDNVEHRKLRIHTRLQLLAKWDPKRYGERFGVEHSGQIELASALEAARKRLKGDE